MNISDKYNQNYLGGYTKKLLRTQSILDVFVLQGLLEMEDAERLKRSLKTNRKIEQFLLKNQLVTRETINKAYSIILKLPFVSLKNLKISENAKLAIPEKFARKFNILPFDLRGNVLKIAITRPSDLLVEYVKGITGLLAKKKLHVELFITTDDDFREALSQYKNKSGILLLKSSLPIVYLRNRTIEKKYLHKLPKNYIEKYRVAVFDKSVAGYYMIACEKYDLPITLKLLEYIRKENNVELELFATAKEDIDFLLEHFEDGVRAPLEQPAQAAPEERSTTQQLRAETKEAINSVKEAVVRRSAEIMKPKPRLVIDSISSTKKGEKKVENTSVQSNRNFIKLKDIVLAPEYLHQLPKDFVGKYRVILFSETKEGELMLATDSHEEGETMKAIEFIKNQHPVKVFITEKAEFDEVVSKL